MIKDYKKRHYLAVKSLSGLLGKITLNHNGDYYCMNCIFSFTTKGKFKSQSVCKNHDYCHMVMLEEGKNIFRYNQDKKCLKTPFTIYADTATTWKIHASDNNPEEPSAREISKHTSWKIHTCDKNPEESSATQISKCTACCFLQRCWFLGKVLCRSKRSCNRNNQLWVKGNTATDRRGHWIIQ